MAGRRVPRASRPRRSRRPLTRSSREVRNDHHSSIRRDWECSASSFARRNRWTGRCSAGSRRGTAGRGDPGPTAAQTSPYLTGLFILAFAIATGARRAGQRADLPLRRRRRSTSSRDFGVRSTSTRTGSGRSRCARSAPPKPQQLFTKHTEAVGSAVHASLTATYRCPIIVVGLARRSSLLVNFWLAVSFLLLAALVWLIGGQIAAHFRREARLGSPAGRLVAGAFSWRAWACCGW